MSQSSIQNTVDQLPVHVVSSLRNIMYSVKIIDEIKQKAKTEGTHVYTKRAEGQIICQGLISTNKADENLLIVYEQLFNNMIVKMNNPQEKIKRRFIKSVSAIMNPEDITITTFKVKLKEYIELTTAKHEYMDNLRNDESFWNIVNYFYDTCTIR